MTSKEKRESRSQNCKDEINRQIAELGEISPLELNLVKGSKGAKNAKGSRRRKTPSGVGSDDCSCC